MTSIFHEISKLEDTGQPGALCIVVSTKGSTPRHTGSKMLVHSNGDIVGSIGGGELEHRVVSEALESMAEGQSRLLSYSMADPVRGDPGICGGQVEIYIEPIMPKRKLVIIGAGHVGKEVAYLGCWLGFSIIVGDDRPEFSNPDLIPGVEVLYRELLQDLIKNIEFTPWTHVVLTTRSVEVDLAVLPDILKFNIPYLGVIGSRRRWETTKGKLLEMGIAKDQIEKIHSPIGLHLNAETPKEIAISIMAEIIMLQKQGIGKPLSGLEND